MAQGTPGWGEPLGRIFNILVARWEHRGALLTDRSPLVSGAVQTLHKKPKLFGEQTKCSHLGLK